MSEEKYYCPVEVTLKIIGGKWKCIILWWLRQGTKRFSDLKQIIPGISQKILTQQLRELETDGLIRRVVYQERPPRVEYSLTTLGESVRPITDLMCDWGKKRMPEYQFGYMGGNREMGERESGGVGERGSGGNNAPTNHAPTNH